MPLFILGFQLQLVGGVVGGAKPRPPRRLATNGQRRMTRLDECGTPIGPRQRMPVPDWLMGHLRSVGAHFAIWNTRRQMARGCETPAIPLFQLRVSHTRHHHQCFFYSFLLSNSFSIFYFFFLIGRFSAIFHGCFIILPFRGSFPPVSFSSSLFL